jgi:hypothetical protein
MEVLEGCATPLALSPAQMDLVEQALLDRYGDSMTPEAAADFVELFAAPTDASSAGGEIGGLAGGNMGKDAEASGDYAVFYACTRIVDLH